MSKPSPEAKPGTILVIAPHPDDEVLGCGGMICRRVAAGRRVFVVFLTSGELGLKHLPHVEAWKIREAEARRAGRILGVAGMEFLHGPDWCLDQCPGNLVAPLANVLRSEAPAAIYLPHPNDGHPDHQATLPLLRMALAETGQRPELWAYEVWTPLSRHDDVEDITDVMAQKLRALRSHRSQLGEFNYVRAIRGLNQYRGALAARCAYAEVFHSIELTGTP